ncbi:MAG: efflux transporter outer membrane subunit [Pirellulaceae bacterium]
MSASSTFSRPVRRTGEPVNRVCPTGCRQKLIWVSCVSLMLAVNGCAPIKNWHQNGFKVGPNYERPAAPVADAWLDAYDERVRSELPAYPAWWEVFDDPQMNALVQSTYEQNLSLRAAGMRVLEARAIRGIAVGGLFPQSQRAFGSYRRDQLSTTTAGLGRLIGENPNFPINRIQNTWSTGFDASWELDIWGRFRRSIEAADGELDASIEDYDAILVTLLAETAAAYVDYRTAQQQLAYARANVETQKGSLAIAQTKFEQGAANELDAQQALANLKNTEQLVPLFEAAVRDANLRLCTLLGIPPRDLTAELGEGEIPPAPTEVVLGVPADLLRRRPDVRAAERRVAAQSARIGVAAADLFPQFSISGAIRLDSERFEKLFSQASTAGFISPGFSWDVLNYGRLINGVRVQDARFQELAYQYQQTVLEANQEVETAINNFLNTHDRLQAAEEAVAASQRAVEIVELQYREGVTDFNRVYNLQRLLVLDQDRLASTKGEKALFLIAAYRAIGGGWEIRNGYAANAAPLEPVPAADEPVPSPERALGGETE